jgi:hypothetical protein
MPNALVQPRAIELAGDQNFVSIEIDGRSSLFINTRARLLQRLLDSGAEMEELLQCTG